MNKAHSLRTLVVLVSCLLLATGAFAAEMVGFGDGASWNLDKADFGGMLSISGPAGVTVQKAFGPGEAPTVSLWDQAGYALPDGQYNWQISLNAAERERGDAAGAKAALYSGTFRIEGGSLLIPKAAGFSDQDSQNKDQVIADDLIVDGSICVGMDCANGESFGFDTIRLKENNLRIKFDDTSNSGSFPNNDWQLTANDSANGGANKFSIDDITGGRTPFTIEAAAPTNSLYVSDEGDVGVGTSTPVVDMHLVDGNSPTLRLEQNGSSGFTPQTWDLAGNEANFFVRDVTNGSKLPFKLIPGAPTNSLYVAASGNVGVGTASPGADLHVMRTSDAGNLRVEGDSVGVDLIDNNATADQGTVQFLVNQQQFRIRGLNDALTAEGVPGLMLDLAGGNVGLNCNSTPDHALVVGNGGGCTATPRSWVDPGDSAWSTTSSRTYKENLTEVKLDDILDRVASVGVYQYDFIDGPENKLGLMAEDFHAIFGRGSDKVLNSQEVQMALWLAVRELTAQNRELAAKMAELEGGISE